jgi:hypothetical protein
MSAFNTYLEQNPDANNKMSYYMDAARKMAKGGMVKKYADGGVTQEEMLASMNLPTENVNGLPRFDKAGNSMGSQAYMAFPNMEVNPGMNRPVNPNDPYSKFYGSGKTEADLRAFYDRAKAERTGTRDIQATDGYDSFDSFLSDYNAGTGNATLLNMRPQQLGNLRPNMFANVRPPTLEETEAARINTTDADLRAYYDRAKADRARTPFTQAVMPLDNYSDFETFLADFRSGKTNQGIKFISRATSTQSTIPGVPAATATDFTTAQQNLAQEQEALRVANEALAAVDPENTEEYERLKTLQEQAQESFNAANREVQGLVTQSQQQQVFQTAQPVSPQDVAMVGGVTGQEIYAGAGQVQGPQQVAQPTAVTSVEAAAQPTVTPAAQAGVQLAADQAAQITGGMQAAQGTVTQPVAAAQQTESSVSQVEAAQGTAILMNNPVKREIQDGELISGSTVDAQKVAELNAMTQAATASPSDKATVQGQLETLMAQFEGGNTPAWAAGAMRNAQATLAQRGLGASSIAGQAIIQAAMEAALPVAQADASVFASFEAQNLSNRQQAAMLAAQQRANFLQMEFDQNFQSRVQNAARIADIANMNFTAEQQIALENSRIANTVNMQNLTNRQAMVMAEASALANLDMANLSNRQQAAVQNAQSFLQMDIANLTNEQQTAMFKAQSNLQALFTDQAAQNAAEQFNASSENQTNQFFANLQAQVSQFNVAQQNAISQFNADEANALEQFNAEIAQQRQLFNAQNSLIIAQANAKWRQDLDTVNTAAQNAANSDLAATLNALSAASIDQIWQRERDLMAYAFQASESRFDREVSILLGEKNLEAFREKIAADEDASKSALITRIGLEIFGGGGGLFG